LRPGQYGLVRASLRTATGAILVPQRAVGELQGSYQIATVDASNKVDIHAVKLGDTVGNQQIIADGLQPGERVIVEGLQKVRQGMVVNPKPAEVR
jgi:membrane fusion protein, multidrug efflux system